jgi:hypothetical protein
MSEFISLASGQVGVMDKAEEDLSKADFKALMLTPGTFESMTGPVEVTAEDVRKLHAKYNERLEGEFITQGPKRGRLAKFFNRSPNGSDLSEVLGIQVRTDHTFGQADAVKGRVLGRVWLMHAEDDEQVELWGTLRILGHENVVKVMDTRYNNLSVTYNPETYEMIEISFVAAGACPEARIEDQKLLYPVALGAKNLLDNRENVTENTDVRLSLVSLLNKGIQDVDRRIEHIVQKSYVTKEIRYLMAQGKILPREYRKGLVNEVMLFKPEDRARILRLMDRLSPQVDTEMYLNNVNAVKGMEMVMNADDSVKTKVAEFQKDVGNIYAKLQGKSPVERAQILAEMNKKLEAVVPGPNVTEVSLSAKEKMNRGVDEDKSRYLEHLKDMLASGKHEELAKEIDDELCNMSKDSDEDEEKKKLGQEELSRKEKDEAEKEKESLSKAKAEFQVMLQDALKASKEELVTLMNKAFGEHNVLLSKFMEEHKDVVSLAKKVPASLETSNNQEK